MAELLQEPAQPQAPALLAGVKRGWDDIAHGPSSFAQMQQQYVPQQPFLPSPSPARSPTGVPAPGFQPVVPTAQQRYLPSEQHLPQQQQHRGALPAPSTYLTSANAAPALQRTANADALLRALDNMAGTLTSSAMANIPCTALRRSMGPLYPDACAQLSSSISQPALLVVLFENGSETTVACCRTARPAGSAAGRSRCRTLPPAADGFGGHGFRRKVRCAVVLSALPTVSDSNLSLAPLASLAPGALPRLVGTDAALVNGGCLTSGSHFPQVPVQSTVHTSTNVPPLCCSAVSSASSR